MVKAPCLPCRGTGSIPGWGTKIPPAARRGQKQKKKLWVLLYQVNISLDFFVVKEASTVLL